MPDDANAPSKLPDDPNPIIKLSTDNKGFQLTPQAGGTKSDPITIDPNAKLEDSYGAIGRIASLGAKPLAPQGRPKHHVIRTPGHLVHKTPKPITSDRLKSQVESKPKPK